MKKVMVLFKKTGIISWMVVADLSEIDQRSYEILGVKEN
jgi:hypothetical protein